MITHTLFDKFQSILPLHCQFYLKSKNWQLVDSFDDFANVWENSSERFQQIRLVLPLDTGLKDYKQRMAEFIETLHIIEERSYENILSDLKDFCTDTLRITVAQNNNVNFAHASKIIDRSLDMLVAAANSVIEPKPYYGSRYSKQIEQYIDSLQLGHTEHGSFVFKIHSPVSPSLITKTENEYNDDIPFARKVLCQLAEILKKSITGANHGNTEYFKAAVKEGISSNFCKALADIVTNTDANEVNFDFTWSLARPCTSNYDRSITIRKDIAEILKEAGQFLRSNIPEEGAEITGYVVTLDKEHQEIHGAVKILDITDQPTRHVYLTLTENQYQEAIKAHSEGLLVNAIGNIEKKYNKSIMNSIIKFSIIK